MNDVNWPAYNVERRPLAELVPYARNARLHSETQISQVAASIREWGWTMPVLVREDGTINDMASVQKIPPYGTPPGRTPKFF